MCCRSVADTSSLLPITMIITRSCNLSRAVSPVLRRGSPVRRGASPVRRGGDDSSRSPSPIRHKSRNGRRQTHWSFFA